MGAVGADDEVGVTVAVDVARRCDRPAAVVAGTDAVYYLAQFPHYRSFPRGAGDLYSVNVAGALRAAEAARDAGARFFCYASTGSVYRPAFGPLREDHPVRRDLPYALSKVAAEEALALFGGPMRCLCTRLFGVFGPGQRDRLVPGSSALLLLSDEAVVERLRIRLDEVDHPEMTWVPVVLGDQPHAAVPSDPPPDIVPPSPTSVSG